MQIAAYLSVGSPIHRCMDKLIRKWYSEVILSFCQGEYSVNELIVCNEAREFIDICKDDNLIWYFSYTVREVYIDVKRCNSVNR